jgi:hypothetical protein
MAINNQTKRTAKNLGLNGPIIVCATMIATYFVCGQTGTVAEETNSATPPATTSTPLKGQVEVSVTLNDLRDARLSISRARKAVANLYDEVTRQQVTMNYNPNLVGTTVIMTPSPSFSGQYLPARKKWVDASMSETSPIINLLKEDVDTAIENDRRTAATDQARKSLDPLRDEAFGLVKDSFERFKGLEQMTAGSTYNNTQIAAASDGLNENLKRLDKTLKKAINILQKDSKRSRQKA